jgi:hypothetical protein
MEKNKGGGKKLYNVKTKNWLCPKEKEEKRERVEERDIFQT